MVLAFRSLRVPTTRNEGHGDGFPERLSLRDVGPSSLLADPGSRTSLSIETAKRIDRSDRSPCANLDNRYFHVRVVEATNEQTFRWGSGEQSPAWRNASAE